MTIDERLDNLMDFLREHMVTKEDLTTLEDRLGTELASKADLDRLTITVDNLTKLTKNYYEE